jgi:hypothetical protein
MNPSCHHHNLIEVYTTNNGFNGILCNTNIARNLGHLSLSNMAYLNYIV